MLFLSPLSPSTHIDVSSSSSNIGAKEITPSDAAKKKDYQLPFDRQLVTSKLASALIMNGMDDLSTDDMNRLLHFFTLLVKTNQIRRQKDRNGGLNFAEVPIRLGLTSSPDASDDTTNSASVSGNDLDIDIGELMKEVESHLAKEAGNNNNNINNEVNSSIGDSSNGMESLTDSDLQTLLQNFKFLSNEEQVHLIGHLRKLEVLEPARVERLRKYVNIAELSSDGESCSEFLSRVVAITRPGAVAGGGSAGGSTSSTRLSASAAAVRRKSFERDNAPQPSKVQRRSNLPPQRASPAFMLDDDDDDDYNFDDLVIKANDTNGRKPGTSSSAAGGGGGGGVGAVNNPPIVPMQSSPNALTFKPAAPKISLKDTENIIANLMGTLTSSSNLQASNAASKAQQQQSGPGGARNLPNRMQQQPPQLPPSLRTTQQAQSPYAPPNSSVGVGGVGGVNSYYNYGSDQVTYPAIPQALPQQPPQLQQSAPNPYSMGNAYNAYGGPAMGHGYGGPINPWASGPPPQPAYNQSYLQQQQQPPLPPQQQQQQGQSAGHYGNMYGGHQ